MRGIAALMALWGVLATPVRARSKYPFIPYEEREFDEKDSKNSVNIAFLIAARKGDVDAARLALKKGADIDWHATRKIPIGEMIIESIRRGKITAQPPEVAESLSGDRAIHLAAWFGHEDFVKFLIKNKAELNVENPNRLTPMALAAENRDHKMVLLLLDAGVDINIDEGVSPIYTPAYRYLSACRGEQFRELLKYKPVVEWKKTGHDSPLMWAAWCRDLELIRILMAMGADINYSAQGGENALAKAMHDNTKAFDLLLSYKPSIETMRAAMDWAIRHDLPQYLTPLVKAGVGVEMPDWMGMTPLIRAAQAGSLKSFQKLVELGASIERTISDEYTGNVFGQACLNGRLDMAKFLIQKKGITRKASLHAAVHGLDRVEGGDPYAMIRFLLAKGVDPREKHLGKTAIAYAEEIGKAHPSPEWRKRYEGLVTMLKNRKAR